MDIQQFHLEDKKVYGVTFNKESLWVYKPQTLLEKINTFMIQNSENPILLWRDYFNLNY